MSLSERRTTPDQKLSNYKLESSNNIINTSEVKKMFNQCLSKSAAASLNLGFCNNVENSFNKEISPFMKTNMNTKRESSSNKKDKDYNSIRSDLTTTSKHKKSEVESEIDSYINETSDSKSYKNTDFNPNYKVESSLNVNVNLVTYPDYFSNSNNDDKVSSSKNASVNVSNSSANYSKNLQKVFSASGYPAANISNFANININNTLPQILINPSTKINNQNIHNDLNVDYKGKRENDKKNDLNRNFSCENNMTKEKKWDEKFNSYSNWKSIYQKYFPLENSVVNFFI